MDYLISWIRRLELITKNKIEGLPKKRKSIELIHRDISNCLLFDSTNKNSYVVGISECDVLFLLDGQTPISVIAKKNKMSVEHVINLINIFENNNLLENNSEESFTKHDWSSLYVTLLKDRKPDFGTTNEKIINRVIDFMVPISMMICVLLLLTGKRSFQFIYNGEITWIDLFKAFILVFITVIFHEISHAVAAKSLGAYVAEYGIVFSFGFPYFYTSICGMKLLSIKSRLKIYSAGIRVDIIFMNLSLLLLCNYNSAVVMLYALLEFCSICMNSIIFVKSDGKCIFKELASVSRYNSLYAKIYTLFRAPVILCLIVTFGISMINVSSIYKYKGFMMILKGYPIIICLFLMALLSGVFYICLLTNYYRNKLRYNE